MDPWFVSDRLRFIAARDNAEAYEEWLYAQPDDEMKTERFVAWFRRNVDVDAKSRMSLLDGYLRRRD